MIGKIITATRMLSTFHQATAKGGSRRSFLLAALAASGLAGCKSTAERCGCDLNSPKLTKLLSYIKENPSMGELLFLASKSGGPNCLRLIIQEGNLAQFYYSCLSLVSEKSPEVDIVVQQMIKDGIASWEKALGLVLLGFKIRGKITFSAKKPDYFLPFLNSKDPTIQLGAIVTLMVIGAIDTLESFANSNSGTAIERRIRGLLLSKGNSFSTEILKPSYYQTAFFRYPTICDEIKKDVQGHPAGKYKVWEIGCSSGLSSESIRIATGAEVIGTDLSPFALLYAMRGKYPLFSSAHVGDDRGFRYTSNFNYNPTDMALFEHYAASHNWDAQSVLGKYFSLEESYLGHLFVSRRKGQEIELAFDDITSAYSPIADNSIDTVVYTNVHYLLSSQQGRLAAQKIYKKLKLGGKLYFCYGPLTNADNFSDHREADFTAVFGKAKKYLAINQMDRIVVFVKD